jgi:hypothetical protein
MADNIIQFKMLAATEEEENGRGFCFVNSLIDWVEVMTSGLFGIASIDTR